MKKEQKALLRPKYILFNVQYIQCYNADTDERERRKRMI